MAKTKVAPVGARIESWEEADRALAEIAVLSSQIEQQRAAYNEEEQKRREVLTNALLAPTARIQELEVGINKFCDGARADFGKAKSRELKHGTVAYRVSPPAVKTEKGFTWASVLEIVRRSHWGAKLVRTKEELNKEMILALNAETTDESERMTREELSSLGMKIEQDENFYYETKLAV